jgi:hypothetical protein
MEKEITNGARRARIELPRQHTDNGGGRNRIDSAAPGQRSRYIIRGASGAGHTFLSCKKKHSSRRRCAFVHGGDGGWICSRQKITRAFTELHGLVQMLVSIDLSRLMHRCHANLSQSLSFLPILAGCSHKSRIHSRINLHFGIRVLVSCQSRATTGMRLTSYGQKNNKRRATI